MGLAVALANTLRPVKGEDALRTVADLRSFLDEHTASAPGRLTDRDVDEARAVRDTVRAVLERAATDPDHAAALLNAGLREHRITPWLDREQRRWRLGVAPEADRCAARLAAVTLFALADVIARLGPDRLGVCAAPDCRSTFADLSKNASKRYCGRGCAHRASVAAYRARRKAHGVAPAPHS